MNLPLDFLNRMKTMLGNDYDNFLESYNHPHVSSLRLNQLKDTDFLKQDLLHGVPWTPNAYYFDSEKPFGKSIFHNMGLYYIQEASAMLPVEVLAPQENEIILDLCAAPGGKSTQIATKMNNTGLLISNEIILKRANILKDNISRLGITNTLVLNESPEKISKSFNNYFDKILVDAPCSGEGMFRKNPEAIQEWSLENVELCKNRQLDILNTIKNCLKENGILVYSTCTFSPQENEQVVEEFLLNNPDFELLDIEIEGFQNGFIQNTKTNLKEIIKTKRVFPHINNGEGHFVAKFRKISSSDNGYNDIKLQKTSINSKNLTLFKDFEKLKLNTEFKGTFIQFGDNLYLLPPNTPSLNKLKVTYSGLLLGSIVNNRFEPSYELALALKFKDVKDTIELNGNEAKSYIHGETISTDSNINGWVLLTHHNNSLSWGKVSNGTIKNHYPKYLRT